MHRGMEEEPLDLKLEADKEEEDYYGIHRSLDNDVAMKTHNYP